MAANASPSANNNGSTSNGNGDATANNGGRAAAPDNSVVGPTQTALRHNPGLSVEWTPDEQSLLEELLTKYASNSRVLRYAKIAMKLQDKTVRDVALRCRWMTKKENGKRRKEDNNSSRKSKDKKEKVTELAKPSSHATNRASGPPYAQSAILLDNDDGISYEVDRGEDYLVALMQKEFAAAAANASAQPSSGADIPVEPSAKWARTTETVMTPPESSITLPEAERLTSGSRDAAPWEAGNNFSFGDPEAPRRHVHKWLSGVIPPRDRIDPAKTDDDTRGILLSGVCHMGQALAHFSAVSESALQDKKARKALERQVADERVVTKAAVEKAAADLAAMRRNYEAEKARTAKLALELAAARDEIKNFDEQILQAELRGGKETAMSFANRIATHGLDVMKIMGFDPRTTATSSTAISEAHGGVAAGSHRVKQEPSAGEGKPG